MHGKFQVRNTFIHFDGAPADKRAVQSMPHGMFKQCISAESSQEATGYDTPSTPSEGDVEAMPLLLDEAQDRQSLPISVGAIVVVEGLVKVPAFNGCSAVVESWDEATGRYNILLASLCGSQQAKIKEENLRLVLPCP